MSVRLIDVTPNPEQLILYCARVSSDQFNSDTGLIRYLIEHKHWSPFELVHATTEIVTSRAIAAQILRHRSFSFQEFSQRYSQPERTIKYQARQQSLKNRQSSVDELNAGDQEWWQRMQKTVEEFTFGIYKDAVDLGIARECARMVLPLATETTLYMSGSLRSWIHYFDLRCAPDTQEEHRVLALDMRELIGQRVPVIASALGWPRLP